MTLHISPSCRWLLLVFCLFLTHLTATAQTVLLSESFAGGSGTKPPVGWATEQVLGAAGQAGFLTTGTHPAMTLFEGARSVEFARPEVDALSAILTGQVTNAHSGNPIVGAKISAGASFTYSTGGGQYTLNLLPGTYAVTAAKAGFDNYTAVVSCMPGVLVHNIAMLPMAYPPGPGTAILNGAQTAVDLAWQFPSGLYEILYDDGIQEDFSVWALGGSMNAVKFSAVQYPVTLKGFSIHIGDTANYTGTVFPMAPFQVKIFDNSGPGGLPGTLLGTFDVNPLPSALGWTAGATLNLPAITSDFYIAMVQGGNASNAYGIAVDLTHPQLRSYSWSASTGGPWVPANGNFMIRARVEGVGGPLPPLDGTPPETRSTGLGNDPETITGYHFWRLKQGEEGNPAVWTSIGTSASPAFTDNSWTSLPNGPYRWACKVDYTGQQSAPTFTNVIGKGWTAGLTVYTERCCPQDTLGPNLHPPAILRNINYPDTAYVIQPDPTGYAFLPNVWLGTYRLVCAIFTCSLYDSIMTITGDTSLSVQLGGPFPFPPRNVYVDDRSLRATWLFPVERIVAFSENWSGGYGPNLWVETPANSNWQITSTFGNPSPSVTFNYSPTLTNYEQYLTSNRVINTQHAPAMYLKYDICLSNFSTSTVENLAVEVWDGTSWTQVKNWTNQWGSMPWTTDQVDLSQYTNQDVKIRFKAWGTDSYNINNWNIDNIEVILADNVFGPPACLLGFDVYLNSVLAAFTTDTSCLIPLELVQYGQTYTFCVNAIYSSSYSTPECHTFTSHFLYPVRNFTMTALECNVELDWDKPLDASTGVTPLGLIGYKIYLWGSFYHSIQDPDSTSFLDINLTPGIYDYQVTAMYDVTPYGFPGMQDESLLSPYMTILVACGPDLPFPENWNSGTFTYNEWTFAPEQGNWNISMADAGTAPYADFSWDPIQTDYHYELISRPIDATAWDCADIWLDVEVKLVDRFATGTESLNVDLFCDNVWTTLYTLANTGSFNWTLLHVNIGQVSGKGFKIRFVAEGQNSSNILHWQIDNIYIYGECIPPLNLDLTVNGQLVDLSWDAPPCNDLTGLAGYMLYRSDSTGAAPFSLVNMAPITETSFTDDPGLPGIFRYYVSARFINDQTGDSLCESVGTDTLTALVVGWQNPDAGKLNVYPNPAGDRLFIQSATPVSRIELFSVAGDKCMERAVSGNTVMNLDVASLAQGVYILQVTTDKAIVRQKVVIRR